MSPIHNKYLGSHLSSFSGGTASVCFISPHCHRRRRRRRRCFLFALDFLEKKLILKFKTHRKMFCKGLTLSLSLYLSLSLSVVYATFFKESVVSISHDFDDCCLSDFLA